MGKMDKIFAKQKQKQEAEKKALEIIKNKKAKRTPTSLAVPKSMKEKVQLAKDISLDVFSDKLQRMELVDDIDRIHEYTKHIIQNGIVAVDTETNGLDRIDGEIAGVCLYTPGEKGIYIPVGHYSYMTNKPLKGNVDKQIIKELFEQCNDANVKYILHNAKFDMHILWWMIGVKIIPHWDTLIASMLLNENEEHGLKKLWLKYCTDEQETTKVASFNSLFNGIEFNKIPPEVGYMYASFDPIMTYELYEFQKQFLDANSYICHNKGLERVANVFTDIEMPLIPVVFEMECTGVSIDTELATQLKATYTEYMNNAEQRFQDEIDKMMNKINSLQAVEPSKYDKLLSNGKVDINIGSNQQLAILFYDIMGFESPDRSKPRGTGEEIISTFKHPIVDAVLEYRGMSKLLSTYIEAIPQHISKRTGKLHANFNQYGAKTGRFSSSNPNLQNIPSQKKKLADGTVVDAGHDIRQMFIADLGMVIVGGDFSQQEPRCLAHMSDDENMLQAYLDGKDLYSTIASKIYGVPYEECKEFRPDGSVNPEGKARRTSVKPVLLGLMYGRGVPSIAEQMNISPKEAQGIIDDFYNGFPKVKEFVQFAQQFASEYGFVETAWGRKRRLDDMLLNPIELKPKKSADSASFNPLGFDDEDDEDYVDDETYSRFLRLSNRAFGREAKQRVKELALQEGYELIDNGGKIADAQRQCVNSIIQGSAADMTKIAMIKVHNDPELNRLGYKLIIPVHDEVLGVCPKENAKAVAERLEYIMIHIVDGKFKIPMKTDIEITERWYGEGIEF